MAIAYSYPLHIFLLRYFPICRTSYIERTFLYCMQKHCSLVYCFPLKFVYGFYVVKYIDIFL